MQQIFTILLPQTPPGATHDPAPKYTPHRKIKLRPRNKKWIAGSQAREGKNQSNRSRDFQIFLFVFFFFFLQSEARLARACSRGRACCVPWKLWSFEGALHRWIIFKAFFIPVSLLDFYHPKQERSRLLFFHLHGLAFGSCKITHNNNSRLFFHSTFALKFSIILNDYIQAIFHSIMLLDIIQNNNIQDSFPSS